MDRRMECSPIGGTTAAKKSSNVLQPKSGTAAANIMKRTCLYCNQEFESKSATAKYCCINHRSKHWHVRHKQPLNGTADTAETTIKQTVKSKANVAPKPMEKIAAPTGLDFSTQMIFKMIEKQRDDYESQWKDEKARNEKLRDEKLALEKEFTNFKYDSEKQKLIDAKPSGLAGIADHPVVKEIGIQLAPHIAGLLGRVMNPGLPEADSTALWLDQQTDEVKGGIRDLITNISNIQDPVLMLKVIQQLISVIQKGSTINPQQQARRTGTDGMGMGNF